MLLEGDGLGNDETLIYIPVDTMKTSKIRHDSCFHLCQRCLETKQHEMRSFGCKARKILSPPPDIRYLNNDVM